MKDIIIILIILATCIQCKENNIHPKTIKIEAQFCKPFTVTSVPAKVTFKEIPAELYFESFTEYFPRDIAPPNTTLTAAYKIGGHQAAFKILHRLRPDTDLENKDSIKVILLNRKENLFSEAALLDSTYLLTFEKAYMEEGDTNNEGLQMLKVVSAVIYFKKEGSIITDVSISKDHLKYDNLNTDGDYYHKN